MSPAHSWTVNYALSLLGDAGYLTEIKRTNSKTDNTFVYHLFVRRFRTDEPTIIAIDANSDKIKSESLRELLDNPVMIGQMRVKQ